ncbi:MAG: hypothetical protein U0326_40535 [Polyangiales bacterium]
MNQELELLRAMQRADRSITLKDRLFVVLTKVDLFDRPDENGNWHWLLAVRNFKDQAIDRVYPYSKVWAHQGVDASHPVARQVQDFYNLTQPASGLEQLQGAIGRYLSEDLEALDVASVESIRKEFNELETRLRGLLVSVKENLNEQEFERRKEQRFDQLWEHIVAGEDAQGLLPAIKANLSRFMDTEISEEARNARAARANLRIAEIRNDLLMRLTPEEAESKRRQMPSPGLMNETAVEIEMRKQMRERVAARVAGLGEDFRDSARESIDRMLGELFLRAEYQGGRLEMLLPPGGPLLDRIDALGRSGQVSEAVLRYQNREIAKADVAFEVLSRYFARQIIDILDATDPTDREIREREMRGLEQFFGMDIADKATRNDPLASIPQAGYAPPTRAAPAGFPQTTPAQFPTQPVEMKPTSRVAEVIDRFRNRGNDGAPQPGAQPAAPQAPCAWAIRCRGSPFRATGRRCSAACAPTSSASATSSRRSRSTPAGSRSTTRRPFAPCTTRGSTARASSRCDAGRGASACASGPTTSPPTRPRRAAPAKTSARSKSSSARSRETHDHGHARPPPRLRPRVPLGSRRPRPRDRLARGRPRARESLKPYDDVLRDVPGAPSFAPAALRSTAACGAPSTSFSSRASPTCTRSSVASAFRAKTTRTSRP